MTDIPSGPDSIPVTGLALVILDGWGLAEPGPGNAISQAQTPTFDALWNGYPHTQLSASGHDVGLPDGQMGNSEVGHLNLGAGAIVKQDLARIDDAIADGSFFENEALRAACDRARHSPRGRLHLLGLVSDGGVHSGWEHIEATIELASHEGVTAGYYALNGTGEMTGAILIDEHGVLWGPMAITNTLAVGTVMQAVVAWTPSSGNRVTSCSKLTSDQLFSPWQPSHEAPSWPRCTSSSRWQPAQEVASSSRPSVPVWQASQATSRCDPRSGNRVARSWSKFSVFQVASP